MADTGALGRRLVFGPLLIVLFAGLFYADAQTGDQALVLLPLAVVVAARGVYEMVDLAKARSIPLDFWPLAGWTALIVAANWAFLVTHGAPLPGPLERLGWSTLAFSLALIGLFIKALARYRAPGGNLERLGVEVLTVAYLGVLLAGTVQLRWIAGARLCYLPLASVVIATKCGDTAAYFAGRAFGRAKLSPLVSPGKTWAGAWGALAGAGLGGWLSLSLVPVWFSNVTPAAWYWSVPYGITLGVVGILGDLAESLIKRDVGRKDSAPLFPGFGGLLDLVDSVLFAGPVALLMWILLPLPK